MIRKSLIILLILSCFACARKDNNNQIKEEYIYPIRNVVLFDELDNKLKNAIKTANDNSDFDNYQFEMLFKDVYSERLIDIDDNIINLKDYDNLAVEIVSVKCSHCKNQIKNIDDFIKDDITFVQYFDIGDKEEIIDFYKDGDVAIPENIIIIPHNNSLRNYFIKDLKLQMYPSLVTFKNGKVSFNCSGEIDSKSIDSLYDIAFNNVLTKQDLTDKDGVFLLGKNRSFDDVKNSLSKDNLDKLMAIDNDNNTLNMTINMIGNEFDFDTMSNSDSKVFINDIKDFGYYKDKKLAVIYTYLKDENDTDKIEFINGLISENKEYEYVVALSEGVEASKDILKKMNINFDCPVISLSARIPDDFSKVGYVPYPSAVFVDRGVFTGVYSNIQKDAFKDALDLFLSDRCIAYKKNN